MSLTYQAVGWNRQKKIYDLILFGGVATYLVIFLVAGFLLRPEATIETLLVRALGTGALLLLHVVLTIGPLCRLDARFLPLLYNRRHLGVATFLLGAGHAGLGLMQFHMFGDVHPLVSLFVSNTRFDSLAWFPFQPLGFLALVILFLMAATSHDFWLAHLTAPVWKTLHMLVYVAYGLIVLHVTLGVLQVETSPVLAGSLGTGLVWVVGLHGIAGFRERKDDREPGSSGDTQEFVEVCGVDEMAEKRARIVCLSGERIAVFRHDGKVSAVSNACQHQNGPLGEGKIVDGCITCPWHGFQYDPETGASPPPFTEKIPTFDVRVERGRVFVRPTPNPAGTRAEPARIDDDGARTVEDEFYVGYLPEAPAGIARSSRAAVVLLLVIGPAIGLLLAASQHRFVPSRFEFGIYRDIEGIVVEKPYAALLVSRPGRSTGTDAHSLYPLVVFGKFGAGDVVEGLQGRRVSLRGSLIYRDGRTMIEVEDGSLRSLHDAEVAPPVPIVVHELGEMTLVGEIVDSKCFLGVMKPGNLKTHRACAVRCISGGIPPVLVVRAEGDRVEYFVLVSATGEPVNRQVLDLVAEPVEITGRVVRHGDVLVLHADPATYRRL